jgi:hypothetical protein
MSSSRRQSLAANDGLASMGPALGGRGFVVRNIGMDRHFVAGHAFRDRLSI